MMLSGAKIINVAITALLVISSVECETGEEEASTKQLERGAISASTRRVKPVRRLRSTKKSSKSGSKSSSKNGSASHGFLNENLVDEFEDLFNMVHESGDFSIRLSTVSRSKSSKKSSKGKGDSAASNYILHAEHLTYAESAVEAEISEKKSVLRTSSRKGSQKLTHTSIADDNGSSRSR